jgi:ketosteroid isomerase-like protein
MNIDFLFLWDNVAPSLKVKYKFSIHSRYGKTAFMKDTENQIKACETSLMDAIRHANADALALLLHDGLLFNLPNGETKDKAFDVETYRSGNMAVKAIEARDMEICVIDRETAVVAVTVGLNANWHGSNIDGSFRYLRVWKKIGAGWQIIAGSVTPLA